MSYKSKWKPLKKKKKKKLIAAVVDDFSSEETEMMDNDSVIISANSHIVGEPINGALFVTTHTCHFCHSSMKTIGVGHGVFECSKCDAIRSRRIVMDRSFESLENIE